MPFRFEIFKPKDSPALRSNNQELGALERSLLTRSDISAARENLKMSNSFPELPSGAMSPEKAREKSHSGAMSPEKAREESHFDPYLEYESQMEERLIKINDERRAIQEDRQKIKGGKEYFNNLLEQSETQKNEISNQVSNQRRDIYKLHLELNDPSTRMTSDGRRETESVLRVKENDLEELYKKEDAINRDSKEVENNTNQITKKEHEITRREIRLNAQNREFYNEHFGGKRKEQTEIESSHSDLPRENKASKFRQAINTISKQFGDSSKQ
jgi:hypothetical protein